MYYIIYQITNKINGKIYIGAHQTNDINDGYMGSGKLLKRAISKYGIEQFVKEIIYEFDNACDMFLKEKELVTADFVNDETTYNIAEGGHGGFHHINSNIQLRQQKIKKPVKQQNKYF